MGPRRRWDHRCPRWVRERPALSTKRAGPSVVHHRPSPSVVEGPRGDLDGAAAARANRPWYLELPPPRPIEPGSPSWTTAKELTAVDEGGVKCALTCAVTRPCRSTPFGGHRCV